MSAWLPDKLWARTHTRPTQENRPPFRHSYMNPQVVSDLYGFGNCF